MPDTASLLGLFIGQSNDSGTAAAERILYQRANRHGVIAGATGTGKTVTLQIMAQGFSDAGVPVFCADVRATCPVFPSWAPPMKSCWPAPPPWRWT